MKKPNNPNIIQKNGYILVTLIIVAVVGIIISVTAVALIIDSTQGSSDLQQNSIVSSAAESGAENAILSILRNPSYTGEVLIVGESTVTTTVTGDEEKIIIVEAVSGNYTEKIEVTTAYVDSVLTVISWKKII